MIGPWAEKTLIGCIIPKQIAHINSIQTTAFAATRNLVSAAFFGHSVTADFYIKTTGKRNLHYSWLRLPLINLRPEMIVRTLMLNCLTNHYSDLWLECWDEIFQKDQWTKTDSRLMPETFQSLVEKWNWNCALRSDYGRRQALVEIDVLSAIALGISLFELKIIYRQLTVLRQAEQDTWYDNNGRIVYTINKALPAIGFPRKASKTEPIGWEDIKDMKSGTVEQKVIDDNLPGGPIERTITYLAPFDRCDREKDYETVWAEFERRFSDE